MYQSSVELECKFVSYSNFFKCAKRQKKKRGKKTKKQRKKHKSLLTYFSETAYVIFFKFGKQSSLVGGHLLSKFGMNRIKDWRVVNV